MTIAEPLRAQKVPKGDRMTYRQEMDAIKTMPKLSRFILILKIVGVVLLAIGLEGLVTANFWLAVPFLLLGIVVSFLPLQVKINVCARCGVRLDIGQAICPRCGVPNM
ncbi:MAG TPA: hypothetical protein VGR51_08550 [Thermoplasmata archaeon]|jgi:hypothetical protein|nr:hypothetical protein [Thermoplasmata archaeon]